MTYDSDPPRLRVSGSPDDPLVQALEEARLELPSKEQLAVVAARFSPVEGGAADRAPISIGRARLRAKSMQAGAVALALAMGAAATVMMRGHFPFVSTPKVEPVLLPSPPASAPQEKATPRPRRAEREVAPTAEEPKEAPPPEEKPRNSGPSPSVRREHATAHEATRPSQADLPSSDVDGARTPEAEAALLGRAHHALGADPSRALALTEEHRRDYPAGLLGQESDLIAIEALAALGRTGDARDRAARFRARYPSSAHLRRIDRLLGEPNGATTPTP
jgi:hypothetical protein